MLVKMDIDVAKAPTKEQIKMLEEADKKQVVFDEDNPELTPEQLLQFKKISDIRRAERRKQSVTLRLSPKTLRKAKSLGKGYTSVLSRILESSLKDDETVKKHL